MHSRKSLSPWTLFPVPSLLFGLLTGYAYGQTEPDFAQAQAMLELLRSCYDSNRRVSAQQYREVL